MKKFSLIITLLMIAFVTIKASTAFVHPGGTTTKADLDRIKAKVEAKESPWIDAWNLMVKDSKASSSYSPGANTDIGGSDGTRQRAARDAQAAYYNILEWYVTGEEIHAQCAVNILNTWASTINAPVKGELFMLPIHIMVQAAEIARLYPGWSDQEKEAFKDCCLNYFYPSCKAFLGGCGSWPGWDGPANNCNQIIGIFCDNDTIYQNAINYYKNGDATTGLGGGRLTNMVYDTCGASIEMGRDIPHAEIGPSAAAEFCLTALNQGTDLFSLNDNLLLKCFEYLMKYELTHECDWVPYNDCDNHNLYNVSTRGAFRLSGFPGPEIIYNHYVNKMGLSAPYTEQTIKLHGLTSYSWEAANFPVLTYIEDGAQGVYGTLPAPTAPTNVQATAGINRINLSWIRPDWHLVNGSVIQRSTSESTGFTTIGTLSMSTVDKYVDSTCLSGIKYYYRVAVKNNSGQSDWSGIVSATPKAGTATYPDSWKLANIGSYGIAGTAAYDQGSNRNVVIRNYSSGTIGGMADNCSFFYTPHTGKDFTFITRIYDRRGCSDRSDQYGIMIRESMSPSGRMVALGQQDVDSRNTWFMPRTSVGSNVSYIGGDTHTWDNVWYKIVRKNDTFTAYQCNDGINWHQVSDQTILGFNADTYVGVYVSRGYEGTDSAYTTGFFDNITLTESSGVACTQPVNFKGVASKDGHIRLSWDATSDALSYNIQRATSINGPYATVADGITATTYTDAQTVVPATDYYYMLKATNFSGESETDTLKVTTADWTGNELPAESGDYYLYNAGTWQFMGSGNTANYGDEIGVNNIGLLLTLTKTADGTYTLGTSKSVSNGKFVGIDAGKTPLWADKAALNFTFTPVEGQTNTFTISAPVSSTPYYYSAASADGTLSSFTSAPTTANGYWRLVSAADRTADMQANATTAGVDATFYIKDCDFNHSFAHTQFWTDFVSSNSTFKYSNTPSNDVVLISNTASAYNICQTVTVPNGYYKVSCQGYYRDGTLETAQSKKENGKESIRTCLYAKDEGTQTVTQTPLMSIFEGASPAVLWYKTAESQMDYGYVPCFLDVNKYESTDYYFMKGFYAGNEVFTHVTNGSLTIGFKGDALENATDVTAFDKVRLTYYGTGEDHAIDTAAIHYADLQTAYAGASTLKFIPNSSKTAVAIYADVPAGLTENLDAATSNYNEDNYARLPELLKAYRLSVYPSSLIYLTDVATYTPAATSAAVKASLNSSFSKDHWNTICLPFAMTNSQIAAAFGSGTKVAAFTSTIGNTVTFTTLKSGESTVAGTPYLILPANAQPAYLISGVTFTDKAATEVAPANNAHFIGNYQWSTVPSGDFAFHDGMFSQSNGSALIKPFRAYFNLTNVTSTDALTISIDGIATSIDRINMNSSDTVGSVYNLNGQLVSRSGSIEALSKGIYLIHGKKIIK